MNGCPRRRVGQPYPDDQPRKDLRLRDSLAEPPLPRAETLELLALGEVIARKSGYGRQLTVRSARAAGASWAEIGSALGTTRQSAWEAHQRWIDGQAARDLACPVPS